MPRPARTDRPVEKHLSLPASIVAQVDLQLFSQLEGKVPHGAWSALMEQLLREWLTARTRSPAK
jgi:hypothetical protein